MIAGVGWNEFGPSSQMNSPSVREMTLPAGDILAANDEGETPHFNLLPLPPLDQ